MNWLEIQMAIMKVAAGVTQFATNWLIQSSLLILVGLSVAMLFRRKGSAVQSLIYRTTLVAVLICPLATWALGRVGVSGWSVSIAPGFTYERLAVPETPLAQKEFSPIVVGPTTEYTTPVGFDSHQRTGEGDTAMPPAMAQAKPIAPESPVGAPIATAATLPTEPPVQSTETTPAETWAFDVSWFGLLSPFVLAGWLIVFGYLIARLSGSWWRMSQLVRGAHDADPATKELCEKLAKRMNVGSPDVRRSPFISSPCLAGLGLTKPANVLLPADDFDLPMRDVLVHELAHLRRRDCHWNLLRQLATSVYFFQPLLWVLSRRIEITAEEVCDDIVVHTGGDRQGYAHRLVDIAELSNELSAAAVAAAGVGIVSLRSMLARRVARILDTRRSLSTRVGNLVMVAVLVCGIAGTVVVGFVGLNESNIVAEEQKGDAPDAEQPATQQTNSEDSERRTYSGSVVDLQGNAVSGADIYLTCYVPEPTGLLRGDFEPVTKSDENGKFRFEMAPSDLGPAVTAYEFKYAAVVAVKPGFGFAVASGDKFLDQEASPSIKLAPDHPIRGHIIDINGQPVAGAKLTLFRVYSNDKHDLSDWNEEARKPRSDFYKAREHVAAINSGALVRSVVSPAVTNEKGEFVMTGVGKGRIVRLLLEGDGIETQKVRVRTEPGEKVTLLREARNPDLGAWTYYPSEFQHICGPSIPVTGIVRDKVSGRPIAGATIKSQAIHGERINGFGSDFIRAVSDKDGRYRLTGLPMGSNNRIGVIVSDGDTAYPSQSKKADTSVAAGNERQREVNFDMTPGVWLSGRVFDADTGKGLSGRLRYYADRSNPNSALLRRSVDERDHLQPNQAGEFRIPAYSGKGYLAFLAQRASDYPRASNITKPDGSESPAPEMIRTNPSILIAQNNNVVAEIDPAADVKVHEVSLSLSGGETLIGQVVGPDNKPLNGFRYYGETRYFSGWKQAEGSEFTLKGCRADVPRHVFVVDTERKMAGYAKVLGDQPQPLIEVAPAGSVKGRVVDEDGQPLAFRPIAPLFRPVPDPGTMPRATPLQPPLFAPNHRWGRFETDADGRFEFTCLLPDTEYRLRVKPKDDPPYYLPLDVVIKVKAGESKDLGDVRPSEDPSLFEDVFNLKDDPVKTDAAINTDAEAKNKPADKNSLTASIRMPDGKPAANTHVAVIGYDRDEGKAIAFAESFTDDTGYCKLVSNGASLAGTSDDPRMLVARRDGYGISWKFLGATAAAAPVQVKLHHQGIIEGKLIDIEGEAAAGETLRISMVIDPSIKPPTQNAMVAFYEAQSAPEAWLPTVTTNENGWFRLTGVPKDHGVYMSLVNSKQFAPQEIALNTGQSEQRGDRDGTYRPLFKNVEAGEEAILTLSPAKVITGLITYEDTGEPVADAKISVWASQQKYGSMTSVTCQTDAEGKYRILPKPGIRFGVTAYPPSGVPYMARKAEQLDWQNSDLSREVNIKLPRVVLVRGRVLEEGTNHPVSNANVTFEKGEESSKMPKNVVTGWQAAQKTDADGNFTFAVPPGRGTLLVKKTGGNYVMKHRMSRQIRFALPGGERIYAHALKLVKTKKGDDIVDVEIHLKPGQKVSGQIVDEQGKLVDEAFVVTNLRVWDSSGRWRGGSNNNLGGKFEILGLDSDTEYPVYFLDAQRKLGATVNLRAGQNNVKVQLKPCGSARAKFNLDDPDSKFFPTVFFVATPGVGKYDYTKWKLGLIAADSDFNSNIDRINYRIPTDKLTKDADGYHTFPALIPGATYRLITREASDWDYKDFTVKSGETLDLGEFNPKPNN